MNKSDLINEVGKVVGTKKNGKGSGRLHFFHHKIKAKKVPKFVPGKALMDAVK